MHQENFGDYPKNIQRYINKKETCWDKTVKCEATKVALVEDKVWKGKWKGIEYKLSHIKDKW